MKKIIRGAVVAAAAVGLAFGAAAPAAADAQSFVDDLYNNGIVPADGNPDTLLAWGYAVCEMNNEGYAYGDIINALYQQPQHTITYDEAEFVVEAANIFLC